VRPSPGFSLVCALAAVMVNAGCGGSSQHIEAPAAPASVGGPGYLERSSNGVAFIQWSRAGNQVAGTFSESYFDPNDPTRFKKQSAKFSGNIEGFTVTLDLDTGSIWTGTLHESRLELGSIDVGAHSRLAFRPASVADYKRALEALTNP
jgi:hypothetical protein